MEFFADYHPNVYPDNFSVKCETLDPKMVSDTAVLKIGPFVIYATPGQLAEIHSVIKNYLGRQEEGQLLRQAGLEDVPF
jgi:hypothetical protein